VVGLGQYMLIGYWARLMLSVPVAGDELVQVHQSFDDDPGWEAINNRILAEDPPTVRQDFGWKSGGLEASFRGRARRRITRFPSIAP